MSSTALKTAESAKDVSMPKPVNVFYVWYSELCRRLSIQPLSIVKPAKPKNQTILDFVADRIKSEEWTPILNALRLDTSLHVIAIRSRVQCKFLPEVDTEEKARHMKRRAGSLYTAFIFKTLLKSLTNCIRRSSVLSALELDGMPIGIEYIDVLLEALKMNKTIKVLSLKYSILRDLGCQLLCNALKEMPNIENLNLSGCGLGALSAQYIAKVVKYQQINRYCASWHNSLRYEDPEMGIMAGLKRITLNNNPAIGDEGFICILDELDDDLWIKAIDMQRCGITESIASRLIDVIEYSRSLEVADFRNNELLDPKTVEHILDLLKNKHEFGNETEYQWCSTATTMQDRDDTLSFISSKAPQKSKSVPCRPLKMLSSTTTTIPLRRMKTCTSMTKKPEVYHRSWKSRNIVEAKKDVLTLNDELEKEMTRRKQSELENKRLKQELEKIRSTSTLHSIISPARSNDKIIKYNPIPKKNKRAKLKTAKPSTTPFSMKPRVEFVFENNTPAHNLLQNLVKQNIEDESDNEDMEFYKDMIDDCKDDKEIAKEDDNDGSNVSLIKLMQDMKNSTDDERSSLWMNAKNAGCFQKIFVR